MSSGAIGSRLPVRRSFFAVMLRRFSIETATFFSRSCATD
jgi:hypothetical protein